MKKGELYEVKKALDACGNLQGVKFAYAIGKNLDKVNSEIRIMDAAKHKPSDNLKEYSNKELKLVQDYAKKDEKHNFVPDLNGQYVIENQEKFNEVLNRLKEQYKDAVEEARKGKEDFETLLDTEVEIDWYKIKMEILPENISAKQLSGIFFLIDEKI